MYMLLEEYNWLIVSSFPLSSRDYIINWECSSSLNKENFKQNRKITKKQIVGTPKLQEN